MVLQSTPSGLAGLRLRGEATTLSAFKSLRMCHACVTRPVLWSAFSDGLEPARHCCYAAFSHSRARLDASRPLGLVASIALVGTVERVFPPIFRRLCLSLKKKPAKLHNPLRIAKTLVETFFSYVTPATTTGKPCHPPP